MEGLFAVINSLIKKYTEKRKLAVYQLKIAESFRLMGYWGGVVDTCDELLKYLREKRRKENIKNKCSPWG